MESKNFTSAWHYILNKEFFTSINEFVYANVKGESLSKQAYMKFGVRAYSDIDILCDRNSVVAIEKILNLLKYYQKNNDRIDRVLAVSSSHQLSEYIKEGKKFLLTIDVNFDILWGEYKGKRIDIKSFLSDIIEMEIYGVKIKTLPLLKAMIQLILHHYKEMNSIYHLAGHDCINYNMFKDVYYLWKNNQEEISLDKLYAISLEYEIIPFVFYVLYFTNIIFLDSDLKNYVEAFKTTEGIELLEWYGLADDERKRWKVDFKKRLETKNLYEFIKNDLTETDIKKLERNRRIFG